MTNEEHLRKLDEIQREIARISQAAYNELIALLRDTELSPRDAIRRVQAGFVGEYQELLLAAFNGILAASIGMATLREMRIGGLRLSGALYAHNREVSATVVAIINAQAKGFQDARKLAMQLYDGYRFIHKDVLPINALLPKYLLRAFEFDPAFRQLWTAQYAKSELKILAGDVVTGPQLAHLLARIQASKLRTPALRASYLQALDALEKGAGTDRVINLLRTAYYERNRYFANRIAQTELHRAYTDRQAVEFMEDDELQYVQVRLSATHPRVDICNLHTGIDKYGLGRGVYPKALTPKPPYHCFCRCVASPRTDIFDATPRRRANEEKSFLRSMSMDEAAKIMGSREKLQQMLRGADLDAVLNAGKERLYHLQRVGDFMRSI